MEETGFNCKEHGHRRYNPLMDSWILVSPHRLDRPWAGQVEPNYEPFPPVDPQNPLLPGAIRGGATRNPDYESVYVFTNDFPAMKPDYPAPGYSNDPLFKMSVGRGICRVICYSPKPHTCIGIMAIQEIFEIINVWINEMVQLGEKFEWVQIFENRGQAMGCSNPHPHGQIWACNFLPTIADVKNKTQKKYYKRYGRPMLMDYVKAEIEKQERLVVVNDDWVCLVPFWATWPYETMILPRTHIRRMYDLSHNQKVSLADMLRKINIKYDNLFHTIFPYSMGWHGAPTGKYVKEDMDYWVFHALYFPPLLRSATIKKFMVGYEMLGEAQRDLTPEKAASILRDLPDVHFILSNRETSK